MLPNAVQLLSNLNTDSDKRCSVHTILTCRPSGRNESRRDGGSACADDVASSGVAPFLSVRTAFDLYLKSLELPRGSLVVCSALTIPDMVSIFEEHGLVPLPVDLDPDTLAPEPGALEAEVERYSSADRGEGTACVRAIYIAHVFGAQVRAYIGVCLTGNTCKLCA